MKPHLRITSLVLTLSVVPLTIRAAAWLTRLASVHILKGGRHGMSFSSGRFLTDQLKLYGLRIYVYGR